MRRAITPLLVAAALTISVTGAAAALTSVATPVSGASPFAGCTIGGPGTNFPNSEVEPWIGVNPTNTNNIVGVYQQDRWDNGGAHGLVNSVTHDGGTTWTQTWAHFSTCSGGNATNGGGYDRASDPWLSFAPNGDLYEISLSASADLLTSAILVSKSTNGGDTWSEPTTLVSERSAFNFNDKESITADPNDSNYVYAVWDRSRKPGENASFNALHSFAFRGDIMLSRTTNAGASWSAPRDILDQNKNEFTIGNQIAVRPQGTLVDIFNLFEGSGVQPSPNHALEAVVLSNDKGTTWTRPIVISQERSVDVRDPDTGADVRAGEGIPDIAVNRANGNLYAVWDDGRFSGGAYDSVVFSQSTNGGSTWSAPVKVNLTPTNIAAGNQQAFTPSVHVADNGTIGVTYYDFRNNTVASGLPTDMWLATCSSACTNPANWLEKHVGGPFNMEQAPVARGYFVGDYEGLTSIGNDFVPLFAQTVAPGETDVFASRITP